jgi:hypothetical protein
VALSRFYDLHFRCARHFFPWKSQIVTTYINLAWLLMGTVWTLPEKGKVIWINSFRAPHIHCTRAWNAVREEVKQIAENDNKLMVFLKAWHLFETYGFFESCGLAQSKKQ